MNREFAGDVARALGAVAVVLCAALLVASLILTPARLDAGALAFLGPCPAKAAGGSCILCGMSHSFGAMAALDWTSAARYNSRGPYLFLICAATAIAGVAVFGRRVIRDCEETRHEEPREEARTVWA